MRKSLTYAVGLTVALILSPTPLSAETLREALVQAYGTNPSLTAARAGQRANDENVPIARARGLPSVSVSGGLIETIETSPDSATVQARRLSGQLGVDVPLYAGGGIRSATRAAEARVAAGQANLRGTESDLFTNVVASYMDVLRDEAIASLNRAQVGVLEVNLRATKDRFEVGDLTRTDVAQSESRLARSQSNLRSAEAQLISSKERYIQLVGSEPQNLEQPPLLPNLPATPGAAVEKALEDNPDLIAIGHQKKAAAQDIGTARSQRLPRVTGVVDVTGSSALGSLKSRLGPSSFPQGQTSVTAGVQATIPLFQGGGAGAQVRQSQARLSQVTEQVIEVERGVIAQTRSAYASWQASNEVIKSSEVAVSAGSLALEGVRAENSVGSRSILDILDAEQELLNAQVQLVSARRNAYVAGFSLLAAMGQAEYQDLGLDGGTLYDPNVNYNRVRRTIWDWSSDPQPATVATRTVDMAAQTPAKVSMPAK
jgi:outer membrane protein